MDKLAAMAAFTAVVETGSFTAAGDALSLPKSRISQRVSDLEHHLGVRLLQRTTRVLRLTEDGRAYYAKCRLILDEIDELEGALGGGTSEPQGVLRVEVLASIARWVLGPKVHEFRMRYPAIRLKLGSGDRIRHLLEEGIDCAIRGGHLDDSSQIARHVCDVKLGLYASPDYIEGNGRVSTPNDLADHQRLTWFAGARAPFAWRLERSGTSVDIKEADGLQFGDPDVAVASCLAGGGICPAAPFAVAGFVRAGLLRPILPEWSFEPRPIHIIYPSNRHLSARVRCFVDWSRDVMLASPSLGMAPLDLAESLS